MALLAARGREAPCGDGPVYLEIARYLNENYVAIKVDREERPDVDAVYMTAVRALTGGGGWPETVCLTLDRKPYYGGTYFPPRESIDRAVAPNDAAVCWLLG